MMAARQPVPRSVQADDGHRLTCHVFEPDGEPRGSVLVLQEIFGVTEHIREVARGYAQQGYRAIAPALFDRRARDLELPYDDHGIQEGLKIARSLRWSDSARDVAAALSLAVRPAAAVGFCWGGTVAWACAGREVGLDAAVSYYGGFIPKLLDLPPRCPVLLHWAEFDHVVSQADREAVQAAFPDVPQFTYAAEHGFNCTQRPVFDAAAASLANARTLEFLASHFATLKR